MNIKDLVKNNSVSFNHYRQGIFYYNISVFDDKEPEVIYEDDGLGIERISYTTYQFPVPLEDIGTATLSSSDKAITYMRWIRKAINDGTLIKL